MKSKTVVHNERSWAIDLIGHLKYLASQSNRSVKDAGGEQTILKEGSVLFPDVLLFGDKATARILQGWELKMPDTGIDDYDFRHNAEQKADALGLDSFLLWNVSYARLYILDKETKQYIGKKEWSDLSDIKTRTSVAPNRKRWESLAAEILGYLNDLFDQGSLEGRQFIESYRSGGITNLIMHNSGLVANALSDAALHNAQFNAEMTLWWDSYKHEYTDGDKTTALAKAVLSNWVGKILFAHILIEKDQRAREVTKDLKNATQTEALELFRKLSWDCDFWTIFSNSLGLDVLPKESWNELKQFNNLLTDLRVGAVDQWQLSAILEATAEVARRKLRGQYTTPVELAGLLVRLCMDNTAEDRVLDPCCGSGTIAREALEQKLKAGVPPENASASVFAGDRDPQAVQIATFALAQPSLMNLPLRVLQKDAFTLEPSTTIDFQDPIDGKPFTEELGQFEVITSNLPFISQEGRKHYMGAIQQVQTSLGSDGMSFSGRADVAAYLPFWLHPLLADRGRLGIIITNAWLGTDWGDGFYRSIRHYYDLKYVITSGAGRWFLNSDVVANILVLEKKTEPGQTSGDSRFIVLKRPIEEMADVESQDLAAARIRVGQNHSEDMTIRAVSPETLNKLKEFGLGGNALFVDCAWVLQLPLVPLKSLFTIRRGERRGCNALFYPGPDHGIESEYIRPLAKSPRDFTRLKGNVLKEAFSCSRTEEELESLGHTGALHWIQRFKTPQNIKKLSKKDHLWYEMRTDRLTDLVMFINYDVRLFSGRLDPPAFVDQRLIQLNPLDDVDIGLCHALLNSSIGMFIIEALGFGRALGALDLNKDRIEKFMHILDPSALDSKLVEQIKTAFAPLLERELFNLADEIERQDRQYFDDAIIEAFDLKVPREAVYESLRELVSIRLSVKS